MQRSQTAPAADIGARAPLHVSRSFSRLEPTPRTTPQTRSRASTLSSVSGPNKGRSKPLDASTEGDASEENADIFVNSSGDDTPNVGAVGVDDNKDKRLSSRGQHEAALEQLPIEIRSLTERFLESLSSKAHKTPVSIDTLSEMFQEFYVKADTHVGIHIATLSSRIGRGASPAPSVSSRTSASSKTPAGKAVGGRSATLRRTYSSDDQGSGGEQQMLTASEIHSRKRARKSLELKRFALEEAVERVVCEKVYPRLWRHRGTDDAERDEKLRSRTAALAVVGVGLKDLLNNSNDVPAAVRETTEKKEGQIREWLSEARNSLQAMSQERYPLGKLRHLTAAHKSIVDTLSRVFPASSSADEILPTVIYTLMSLPPEGIDVVSNLNFIQRFRATHRINGEAAYCLVNLEAAISFLETVDLSSLRADAVPKLVDRSSSPLNVNLPSTKAATPTVSSQPIKPAVRSPSSRLISPSSNTDAATSLSHTLIPPPSSPTSTGISSGIPSRRLSNLIQSQTNRLEAAGDAMREAVLDGADQAFDSISNTLDNSFKFLFGRLREQQEERTRQQRAPIPTGLQPAEGKTTTTLMGAEEQKVLLPDSLSVARTRGVLPFAADGSNDDDIMPRTLEDARRLVSSPSPHRLAVDNDDAASISGASSINEMPLSDDGTSAPSAIATDDAITPTATNSGSGSLGSRRPRAGSRLAQLSANTSGNSSLRPASRDHSADSARSGASSPGRPPTSAPLERTVSASSTASSITYPATISTNNTLLAPINTNTNTNTIPPTSVHPPLASPTGGNAAVESMRNLGNTLNPLNRFSGMGILPRFGRGSNSSSPAPSLQSGHPIPPSSPNSTSSTNAAVPSSSSASSITGALSTAMTMTITPQEAVQLREASAVAALEDLKRTAPPMKRFLEMKDAGQLRLEEVGVLLRDYQRLAEALRGAIVG